MSDETEEEVEDAAEDDFDEEFEIEPDAEAEVVEDEILDPDLAVDEPLDEFAEAEVVVVEEEEEEEEEAPQPRARKVADEEEDEDEEQDPDDVEADLEAILRDRMAAADDEDEDEPEDGAPAPKADGSTAPRNDEFVCDSCFMLVNRSQFGSSKDPRCPMGDPECPSIVKISADMVDEAANTTPGEQLIELLVYAPVGLLYEYQDVIPQLVKRGKSQVQLARIVGQMAADRSKADPAAAAGDLAELASTIVTRIVAELGCQFGHAPSGPPATESTMRATSSTATPPADGAQPADDAAVARTVVEPRPLPIARYDELTAREIISLLDDLTDEQRSRVRAHELANRNRKTVLAKLDRLES